MSDLEPFVHDGSGPDVDPVTGDEAETEELPREMPERLNGPPC